MTTWRNLLVDPVATFDGLLVIFTTIIAIVGVWQVHLTRSASRRQLRAYVSVDAFTVSDGATVEPIRGDKLNHAGISIHVRNSGQTPAYEVLHWCQIDVRPAHEESTLVVPELERVSQTYISPSGAIAKFLWMTRAITQQEQDEIARGERAIYVYGKVTYRDAFKKERSTSYRLRYMGIYPPMRGATLTFCNDGNVAT